MTSLVSILDVAGEGIAAQTVGLDVTGQNISNVNTPGYVDRTVDLETTPGGGVTAAGVERTPDSVAADNAVVEGGLQSAASARDTALANAEAVLAPTGGTTIADQANAFFSSMTALAQSPSDPTARSATLAAADQLAEAVSSTATQLAQSRQDLLGQAQGVAVQLDQQLTTIASLNKQIVAAQAGGNPPADLMDQRDALVSQVGQGIDVQVINQPSGAITLLSSGAALVDGANAAAVGVAASASGDMAISVQEPGGGATDITTGVTSGTLGGIREARDTDLSQVSGQLDQYAYDLTNDVNALHTTGYGLDGQTGRPLFQPSATVAGAARAMEVSPLVEGKPDAIAATASASSLPGGNDLALAIAGLASQPQGTSSSPAQAFSVVSSTLGSAKQSADAELSLRNATVAQANSLRDSADGVSIAGETVNLARYQQAFQASQQVLQTVDSLLDGFITTLSMS